MAQLDAVDRAPTVTGAPSAAPGGARRSRAVAALPTAFALGVALAAWLGDVRTGSRLWWSLLCAAAVLVGWNALLLGWRSSSAAHGAVVLSAKRQHYLQACAQACVLAYWGWYWPPVYEAVPLLLAQLAFAYGFDMLLAWARGTTYPLGFGPVPVVFSTNLFLWFKPDWFYLQFAMLAVGFAAKALLRWTRDGQRVHIFNPSSFPLALFSLGLIAAGASDITRGQDIAITQFYPPQMYLLLFLIGLPGQYFFGVASMTLAAVATTYLLGATYFVATGTYFFYDSYIPIAVFLGMHLLFTDPSTSPRTELGRLAFGSLYGASSMVLYVWLGALAVPAFYDKLLQVPLLNLSVRLLDRLAASPRLSAIDPTRWGRSLTYRQRGLAYMLVWAAVFAGLSAVEGVGDRHPGQWVPFWERACEAKRPRACRYLAELESILCEAGSGWACNESGVRMAAGHTGTGAIGRAESALQTFERGCRLGFLPACQNARLGSGSDALVRAHPALADYRVLARGSKAPVVERSPEAMYARACEVGWTDACDRAGRIER